MDIVNLLMTLTTWVIPVLLAITLHEAAHGYAAYMLGDDTARQHGRLSLNPIVHIDPVGTIAMPLLLYIFGGFLFGYAKPVPVNFGRLRNPRRDMILVALAGPATNLLLAVLGALLIPIVLLLPEFLLPWLLANLQNLMMFNLFLAVLNMLPLPPLDGGRVMVGLLPFRQARKYQQIEPYGIFILVGVIIILPMIFRTIGIPFDPARFLIWQPADFLYRMILGWVI